MAKTKRQRPDKITNPSFYADPIADGIHHAIKPLDRVASRMELKYGSDRLETLCSPATARRFGSAKAKLDQAILDNDADEVQKRVIILMRGWSVMDNEATEKGFKPLTPQIWSHTTDAGFKFAVAQGNADAIKAIRTDGRMEGVAVYSLEEIGRILENQSMAVVNSIKMVFPDAKVTKVKAELNDDVPF